ncbi:ATP-binding protein [Streptomyces mirabilis]
MVDDARLVVSELVGNVVHHVVPDDCLTRPGAARKIDVLVKAWPGWLFIGVADEDSTPPDLPAGEFVSPELAGDFAEAVLPDRGRGLLIVQRLADAVWWSPKGPGGKTVWCRFDLDGTT